jgi:SPX domain protein involved in polyphosphate accumulation
MQANRTGFRKILKKHDKLIMSVSGSHHSRQRLAPVLVAGMSSAA